MASTNQTTNYGLPLYQTGDQALWTDTNTPFEEIDTALKTASDNASGAASSVSALQTTVTTLAQVVSGHTTQLNTLELSVATASTAQGTSFTAHGLNTATNVQTAIQNAGTSSLNSYDNTTSGLNASNVQSAIDEVVTTTLKGVSLTIDTSAYTTWEALLEGIRTQLYTFASDYQALMVRFGDRDAQVRAFETDLIVLTWSSLASSYASSSEIEIHPSSVSYLQCNITTSGSITVTDQLTMTPSVNTVKVWGVIK